MTRKGKKPEERKVRASDFAMYQTAESRPTGLHHIFDAFHHDAAAYGAGDVSSSGRSEGSSCAFSEAQAEIVKALDKLTKKDGTTKLKALEQLQLLLENSQDYVLEGLIPDFTHLFKRLAVVEPLRKIRLNLGQLLRGIATSLKRRMQAYMEGIVTHWWMAMHDDAPDVAAAYCEAFQGLFTTAAASPEELDRKTFRVLVHYMPQIAGGSLSMLSRDIESYKRDWLDVFGKTCDNCATVSDMHNRLICSLLHSLMDLLVYQRKYGHEVFPDEFPVSVLISSEFVGKVGALCRSGSFKQRFASARVLVEFVKVLRTQDLSLAKDVFKIGMQRLHADEEAPITYQHVRLICACARYNSACWEPVVLDNFAPFVKGIMDRYTGDFSATTEFYSLCPCLVSYLPQGWLRSPAGVKAVLEVTAHLLKIMRMKLDADYEQSFTFDAKLFSQMGSSMLYCYYRILLLVETGCDLLVDHAFAPLLQLKCETSSAASHFLLHLPRIFTEFVEESEVLRGSGASDSLLSLLREMHEQQSNGILLARIFASLAKEGEGALAAPENHAGLKSYARDAQLQSKSHILQRDLPPLLMSYLEEPRSRSQLARVDELLGVVDITHCVPLESPILEAPRFLMSHRYPGAWEFEGALSTICRVLAVLKPVLEDPEKYYPGEADINSVLLVSLVALQKCENDEEAVTIAGRVYGRQFKLHSGNCLAVFLKFVQASQRFAQSLSRAMLSWLMDPMHICPATCEAIHSAVDTTALDAGGTIRYYLLHSAIQLGQKVPSKGHILGHSVMVDDLVSFYLVGYYANIAVRSDALLRFSLALLPSWDQGHSAADGAGIICFLQLLQQGAASSAPHSDAGHQVYAPKDVVYTMLALQGTPRRSTWSISRTVSALASAPAVERAAIYDKNAILFSQLWLMNCEKYLFAHDASGERQDAAEGKMGATGADGGEVSGGNGVVSGSKVGPPDLEECFAKLVVATIVHSGFSCPLFEKLVDKVVENGRCTALITDTLVRRLCSASSESTFEFESLIKLFSSYLAKLSKVEDSTIELCKRHYTSNQFVGGFVAALNRRRGTHVTALDNICQVLNTCGKGDVVLFTNCLLELTQVFDDAVSIADGVYSIGSIDRPSFVSKIKALPPTILGYLGKLELSDPVSTCWMHSAFVGLFRSCVGVIKATALDMPTFANMVGGAWLLPALNFCYRALAKPSHLVLALFADIVQFSLANDLVELEDLRVRPSFYDFSASSLNEYFGVLEALSNENISRVQSETHPDMPLDSIDAHYLVSMFVNVAEAADSYAASADAELDRIQRVMESLKAAAYGLLSLLSRSNVCHTYMLCKVSRLWRCSFLFSNIADYSGTLCQVDLEHSNVHLMLPYKFASTVVRPTCAVEGNQKSVPVDVSRLLFNLVQGPAETDSEAAEDSAGEQATPRSQTLECRSARGRQVIAFYLDLVLGPHFSAVLFQTYEGPGDVPHRLAERLHAAAALEGVEPADAAERAGEAADCEAVGRRQRHVRRPRGPARAGHCRAGKKLRRRLVARRRPADAAPVGRLGAARAAAGAGALPGAPLPQGGALPQPGQDAVLQGVQEFPRGGEPRVEPVQERVREEANPEVHQEGDHAAAHRRRAAGAQGQQVERAAHLARRRLSQPVRLARDQGGGLHQADGQDPVHLPAGAPLVRGVGRRRDLQEQAPAVADDGAERRQPGRPAAGPAAVEREHHPVLRRHRGVSHLLLHRAPAVQHHTGEDVQGLQAQVPHGVSIQVRFLPLPIT
ncbi:HEAT/U-box domain-containing protein [Babesia caballi]|uniref:E3 ubiquitin-protein ligase listerin n=1 Tax=Babesia caballi TaxID=5871 RepID=A0AAV4LR77_BABCB|nr:HEAT/U-box domain-containing protein [Babesia caballi]